MNYEEFITEWRSESDSILCRTSGSTGLPKDLWLDKKMIRESAWRTIEFFRLSSQSHLHSCISPDYIGGKMMAVRAELSGAKFTFEIPSNRPLSEYNAGNIDLLAVVPSQMIHILDNLKKIPFIRNIIIGGAPIPAELRKKIAGSGLNAFETYGMTETASHIALRRVTETENPFKLLPGIGIAKDSENRLIVMISNQRILTNDIVEIYQDDEFGILGRHDNVINSGGKKIHPEMIEAKLEERFGCEVTVTSEADEKWGERVILIIEDGKDESSDEEIINVCKELLSREEIPKEIRHQQISRTQNGKKIRIKST